MANIMSMTKLRNKTSRSGFDLSNKNLFTAKVGEALPVACIECIPGDSFEIDMAWFTRTQPVNTAAYTRMREYYDWYFVPTNLLWNKFNTFVTQMTDNNQKATGINNNVVLTDEHPYFTYNQVIAHLQRLNSSDHDKNFFGFNRAKLSARLLDYLDYGDFTLWSNQTEENGAESLVNPKLNPFPLLAYQKIYQDHIRDSQWEKAYAPAANIDYISGAAGTLNLPISDIDLSTENMFDLRYFNWNKDYFMGLLPKAQYGDAASISVGGSQDFSSLTFMANEQSNQSFHNTIELTSHGDNSYAQNSPFYLMANYVAQSGSTGKVTGRAEVGTQTTQELGQWFNRSFIANVARRLSINPSSISSDPSAQITSMFTILQLRQAEAKQKWAEITQSQQQDYKSQIGAHFGVDVSDAYSDRCKYIGGVNGNLDIEAVTNQNLSDGNAANIAGRGQGGSRGTIEFDTKVHGYLMCIYHCTPILDYQLDGIKRHNLKTSVYDYAIPEFDSTGMVSVPLVELTSRNFTALGDPSNQLLGYAPRYIDYKSRYDLVHGAFKYTLKDWVAPVDMSYIAEYLSNLGSLASTGIFNYHFFKVPPSVVNPIFGVDADESFATDQLLINASFDIKAVRNLDRNGLPY